MGCCLAELEATLREKDATIEELKGLLRRYRNETPLGHQPHMIAEQVDAALLEKNDEAE